MSDIVSKEEFDPNMSCDEFLKHFGILGMKWGKTKGQKDAIKSQKADKKWEKSITGKKNTIAFEFTNKVLSKLDDNPNYDKELSSVGAKLEKQGKTGRDLDNAYQKQMIPISNKHLLKTDMAYNPSKTKVLQVKEKEIDGDIYMIPYLKTLDDRETKHSEDLFDEESLLHFGILGMKWGRRKGGSSSSAKTSSTEPKEDKRSADYKQKQELRKKKPSEMTNKEIQALATRLQLEKSYKELTKNDISPGAKFAKNLLLGAAKQQTTVKFINSHSSEGMGEMVSILAGILEKQ